MLEILSTEKPADLIMAAGKKPASDKAIISR
jgi:hypothetical protein